MIIRWRCDFLLVLVSSQMHEPQIAKGFTILPVTHSTQLNKKYVYVFLSSSNLERACGATLSCMNYRLSVPNFALKLFHQNRWLELKMMYIRNRIKTANNLYSIVSGDLLKVLCVQTEFSAASTLLHIKHWRLLLQLQ